MFWNNFIVQLLKPGFV